MLSVLKRCCAAVRVALDSDLAVSASSTLPRHDLGSAVPIAQNSQFKTRHPPRPATMDVTTGIHSDKTFLVHIRAARICTQNFLLGSWIIPHPQNMLSNYYCTTSCSRYLTHPPTPHSKILFTLHLTTFSLHLLFLRSSSPCIMIRIRSRPSIHPVQSWS